MPYMVQVLGARLGVEGSDANDAERAEEWLQAVFEDELAASDLERELETIARDAPTVRAWVLALGEELDLSLHVVADGGVDAFEVTRAEGCYLVEGHDDLGAIATEVALEHFAKVGKAKPAAVSDERKRIAAKEEEARAAVAARDIAKIVDCLRAPELGGARGVAVRTDLVRALVVRPLPKGATPDVAREVADALIGALRDDAPEVAHGAAYRLYTQQSLAPRVLDELLCAWRDRPRTDIQVARLAVAVAEWPDFPYPAGFLESAPTELRRLLDRRFAEEQPKPKLSQTLGSAVEALEKDEIRGFRRARLKTHAAKPAGREKMRATFASRLVAIAGATDRAATVRAAAMDLLRALGVTPGELGPLTVGMPEVAGVRELRLAASPEELAMAPLSAATLPTAPAHDWREVLGAARYPGAWIVVNRRGSVAFETEAGVKWRIDGLRGAVPLRPLGDPGSRVYLSSNDGLQAFDRESGRALWWIGAIDQPTSLGLGVVNDPRPTIWTDAGESGDQLLLMGTDHVTWINARTGTIEDVAEIPFSSPHGLAPVEGENGVIVLDGSYTMPGFHNEDFVASGLVIRRDRSTEDRVIPKTLGSVVRAVDGARADFSPVDVVIEVDGKTRRWALPDGISRIGPIVREIGRTPRVLVFKDARSGVFGDGSWLALPLTVT